MKTPLKGLHPYFWRSAAAEAILPKEIPTLRVYYTWRLLWNHLCVKSQRTPDFQGRRSFGPFYTNEYLLWSLEEFAQELKCREDLPSEMKNISNQRISL